MTPRDPGALPQLRERLRDRLHAVGLGHIVDDVVQLAQPCIRLHCHGAVTPPRGRPDTLPVGQSKIGGVADLPAGVNWPSWNGQPMAFIAQIRLDAAAPFDAEGILPRSGLLSFFCATDGGPKGNESDDDPATWRVLFFEGDAQALERQKVPEALPDYVRFNACPIECGTDLTLPDLDDLDVRGLRLTGAERSAYLAVESGSDGGELFPMRGNDHRLLGNPYNLGGNTLLACYLAAHGITWDEWETADARRRAEIMVGVAGWRLLLQVDSSEVTLMDWAGGGVLHYCIPEAALRARDFSEVWLNMQFL